MLDYLNTKTGQQGRRIVAGALAVFWAPFIVYGVYRLITAFM